jgi:hypothetical protein
MQLRSGRGTAGLSAEGEIGIGSAGGCVLLPPPETSGGLKELLDSGRDLLHGADQPLGFMSRAPLIARAESAPLGTYVLQIEDIRRLERNDVLPIPISPSVIVKKRRVV